ncbi:oligosaccharide flippase family protein [Tropicibacter sp. R15_0]|nr:oligosaccharide flippase family protein [Tropicibacter sp. R15_0]
MQKFLSALKDWELMGQFLVSAQGTGLRLFSVIVNMVIGIVLARLLGDDGFGQYVSYLAFAGLLASICALGLPAMLAREVALARGTGQEESIAPIAQMILATLTFLILALLGVFLWGSQSGVLLVFFVLGTTCLGIATNIFNGFERVVLGQWVGAVFRPLLAIAFFFMLAWTQVLSVNTAVFAQGLTAFLATLLLFLVWPRPPLLKTLRGYWYRLPVRDYRQVFQIGLTFAFSQTLINAMTQIDILIMTALRPSDEVAWYYAAARAAFVVSFFFGSVCKIAEPRIIRLYAAGDRSEMQKVAHRTVFLGVVMTILAILFALLLARPYLLFYGEEYLAAMPALVILLIAMLFSSMIGPAEQVLRAARADSSILVVAGISVGCAALLAFLLIPLMGMNGAAIATGAQFIIFQGLQAYRAWKLTGVGPTILHAIWQRAQPALSNTKDIS